MVLVKENGESVEIADGFDEDEVCLMEALLKLVKKYKKIVEKDNVLESSKVMENAIKTCMEVIAERSNSTDEQIEELKDQRRTLINKLKDLRDEATTTNKEFGRVTCAVQAYDLLTNTKIVPIQNKIVGKMSNEATGKSKTFEYMNQDPELSNKLWNDVGKLSNRD